MTQAHTPFYADKSFWLVVLGFLAPLLAKKLGIELNVDAIAGQVATLVAFVVMSKWKQVRVLEAEKAGTTAAAEVKTTDDALKAMAATPKP